MYFYLYVGIWIIITVKNLNSMNLDFNQNLYVINLERANTAAHDENVIGDDYDVRSFKTRTDGILMNITLTYLIDIKDDLKTNIQAFQFLSNVYRATNINMTVDVCKMMRMRIGGLEALQTTNGNFSSCPIHKGTYVVYNYKPESRKFPPLVPEGRYKVVFTYIYENKPIGSFDVYGAVVYKTRNKKT